MISRKENYQNFFKNGICEIDFKSNELDSVLKEILEGRLKEGYSLETKYSGTYDLRPDVIGYNEVFWKALIDNDIKNVVRNHTLKNYSLFHVQVRVVENGKSYMDWHRDTYYTQGSPAGKTPSGVKIIYYPKFDEKTEDRLLYLVGSNRILFPTSEYDRELFKILSAAKISSSNEKAILFDTSGLHSVVPEKEGKKSIRLIYNFLDEYQILDDHSNDELHMRTMKKYEEI